MCNSRALGGYVAIGWVTDRTVHAIQCIVHVHVTHGVPVTPVVLVQCRTTSIVRRHVHLLYL